MKGDVKRIGTGIGIGIGLGVLSGVGALQLEQHHLYLLVIVLALASGVLAGALVGWRQAPSGDVARDAMLTGAVVVALLAVGEFTGGAASAYLRLAVALVSLALCMGAIVAFAGLVSAWTGYHPGKATQGSAPVAEPPQHPAGPLPTMA